ncbi:hypothetical protein LXA43DRAFT_602147 [Ganoderma leucocontextum]|nr:hypothetical protein LXA43DRAFT_602147 [Ganoderma leucocontextum]
MDVDVDIEDVTDDSTSDNGNEDYTSRKMRGEDASKTDTDTPEQKELREQIAYHDSKVIQLKQALNLQRPTIAKVPPEILAEIFLHQAAIVRGERVALHEDQGGAEIHRSFYEWTNVTQVCHHWRDVALKCPRLWTWLAFEEHVQSQFTDMIAERSHKLPLTVVLTINSQMMHCEVCLDPDGQYQYPDIALWMVNKKLPRIHELAIFIDREIDRTFAVGDIWDPVVNDPAPILEDLQIEAGHSTRYTQETSDHPAELVVRNGLFGGRTPKLRSLTVGGVGIHFANPLFCSTLRRLKISDCQCLPHDTHPDKFNAWLLALERLTSLEVLEVDWSIPAADAELHYQLVSVRKLKHLHLATTIGVFTDHMGYVRLPRSAAVRFSCTDANLFDDARMSSLRAAASFLFRRMSVYRVSYGMIHPERDGPGDTQLEQLPSCQLWATLESSTKLDNAGATSSPIPTEGAPPRFTFSGALGTRYLPVIFGAVDLSRVHTIHVTDFASGDEWVRVLKNAPNVTTLYAHGMAAFGIPAILASGVPGDVDLTLGSPIEANDEWFWAAFMVNDGTNALLPDGDGDGDQVMTDATSVEQPTQTKTAPLFPSLRTLKFVSVDFLLAADAAADTRRVTEDDLLAFEERGLEYGFDVEALVKSLRTRRAQGAADIASVEFRVAHGLCGDMAQLMSLVATVPEVKWDGVRLDSASLSS